MLQQPSDVPLDGSAKAQFTLDLDKTKTREPLLILQYLEYSDISNKGKTLNKAIWPWLKDSFPRQKAV